MMLPIPNYPKYLISEFGLIVSHHGKKEKIIKEHPNQKGYLRVRLANETGQRTLVVHRLVAKTFIGNPLNLPVVNHKDGNKQNNYYQNLEWCSVGYNQLHAYRIGLRKQHQGAKHGRAKLTDTDIKLIRSLYATGSYTYTKLAKLCGVGKSMVGYILTNKNWTHI